MNEQEQPNEEKANAAQPEVAPNRELRQPEPTPPVYGPPPVQAQPGFQAQPPQYAAPHQSPAFQTPAVPAPMAPQYGQAPPQGQVPEYGQPPQHGQAPPQYPNAQYQPGAEQYAQAPQHVGGVQYPQQVDPAQYPAQYPNPQFPEQQYTGGQQYAPGVAPVAPAHRKGLPVGAWIALGAGALVLVLLVIAGAVAALQKSFSAPTPPPGPMVTEELPEQDPGASKQLDVVTLDDTATFSAGPYWGVPIEDGWEIVKFDEQGVNEFTNPVAGCQFLTYQGYGPEVLTKTDDRGATEETISTALQIGLPWTAATAEPAITMDGSVEVPVDWTYKVEMQQFVAAYPTAGGDRERQVLLRTFMPNNLALYAEVDCPATTAGNEAAQVILDGLTITEY